jgi:hypothetical protein
MGQKIDMTAPSCGGCANKPDRRIRAWFKRFLAGEFDSSGIFEHPDAPLPDEQFDLDPKDIDPTDADKPVVGMDLDISEAVEARIREIKEKGTYSF